VAQESSALVVVVNKKMQERTRTETATNAGIGIIAVGRDDLKWNEEVQTQQRCCLWKGVIACGRKLLALISFRVCSLVDGDHFFCRTEKIYGQTWIRDGPMSNYSNQSTDIPLNSSNE
jgi:hypothetical protein